ncbi:MAG: hypothetical protein O3C67_00095 [Cyanobacteria bacterium]|nr:hypothetical protein [Cyanobacteriota bacterium]
MSLIKLGCLFSGYLCLSLVIFFGVSNTVLSGIFYIFFLLPLYGVVLLGAWYFIWRYRTRRARVKWWIWGVVLGLQIATLLASPGNCYNVKQGDRCYSNLQILVSDIPRTGASTAPHWPWVEDAFPGLLFAYGTGLFIGLTQVSTVDR